MAKVSADCPWPVEMQLWAHSHLCMDHEGRDGTFRPTNLTRSPGERYSHLFLQDLHPAAGGLFFSFLFLNPLQGEANSPPWLGKGTVAVGMVTAGHGGNQSWLQ